MRIRPAFLVLVTLAALSAAGVWFGLPQERTVSSLWMFIAKLVPFVLALEAIAQLDPEWARRIRLPLILIPLSFAGFFLFFVPKLFFHSDDFPTMYYYMLTLVPFIILALSLAYRLGGGAAATTRRLGYAMVLVMISGAEDLAFLTVNHQTDPRWTPIPDRWFWASHMIVRLGGHIPTQHQAYAFIAVHIAAAAIVLMLPQRYFDRVGDAVRRLVRRDPPAPVADAPAGTSLDGATGSPVGARPAAQG